MNALNASLLAAGLLLGINAVAAGVPEEEGFVADFITPEVTEEAPVPAVVEAPAVEGISTVNPEGIAADAPAYESSFDTGPAASESGVEPGADTAAPASEPPYADPVDAEEAERRSEALKASRGPYLGISGGSDHVSIVGIDDGSTSGLTVGYRFNKSLSAEFTLNSGSYDAPTVAAPSCAVDSLTTGLFVAARGEGPFYLKGRVGVLSETLESSGACGGAAIDDAGISAGVGAGVRLGRAAVEFEYTQVEKEIYRLGWTLLLNF